MIGVKDAITTKYQLKFITINSFKSKKEELEISRRNENKKKNTEKQEKQLFK